MSAKATYLTLRFGGATAPIALFATSGKPTEAKHDTRRVVVEQVPPGEGDVQTEAWREFTGATDVRSMRVETVTAAEDPRTPHERQADAPAALPARPVPVGAEPPLGNGDVGDPLADDLRALAPPAADDPLAALGVNPDERYDDPAETREEATNRHTETRAEYKPPPTTVQQGVTLDDGTWIDLTDRLAEIDQCTKVTDAEGKPVMEVVATIASSAIGRERIRNAKYVGGADPKTYKVLRLIFEGLGTERAAVVRWTERTTQRLGILVARTRPHRALVLLEVEWSENMREPAGRVTGPLDAAVTSRELEAAAKLMDALHAPPSALNDLRDERLAHRAELLAAAREGRLEQVSAPPEPEPVAETEDVAEALLVGVR